MTDKRNAVLERSIFKSAWGEHEGGGYDPLVLKELICPFTGKMRTATPYEVAVHFASGQVITCTYKSRWVVSSLLYCFQHPTADRQSGGLQTTY